MKILNLFAGIGGNRALWGNEHEITAVENDQRIAMIYQRRFPDDKTIIGDAYEYLEQHYMEYDFLWLSPPCPTHSRMQNCFAHKSIPDMRLYGMVIFLRKWSPSGWVVENVISYYNPLILPTVQLHRHYFWSNFPITKKRFRAFPKDFSREMQLQELCDYHSIDIDLLKDLSLKNWANHDGKRQILRNCVKPEIGRHVLDCYLEDRTLYKYMEVKEK